MENNSKKHKNYKRLNCSDKRSDSFNLETILLLLKNKTGFNPRISGSGYISGCPAHDDKFPSLSVAQKDNKILFHCFQGCSVEEICDAIGISIKDLFLDKRGTRNG